MESWTATGLAMERGAPSIESQMKRSWVPSTQWRESAADGETERPEHGNDKAECKTTSDLSTGSDWQC